MHTPLWLALFASSFAAASEPEPTTVMILGTFHMSNPGHDLHNQTVDDVLSPPRQKELEAVTEALARFRPSRVAVEWPAEVAQDRYPRFVAGTLTPSRNEVVQLGFRLAERMGLKSVDGIDVDGSFPYDAVEAFAKTHGQEGLLARLNGDIDKQMEAQTQALARKGVLGELRLLNDPARIAHDNDFYRSILRVGAGSAQPGAEVLTAWYGRNFQICARLLQLSAPGEHVVVLYGSGHAFLLRQCVQETPGMRLAEPNDYLPAP
jgi:hypothetical protein